MMLLAERLGSPAKKRLIERIAQRQLPAVESARLYLLVAGSLFFDALQLNEISIQEATNMVARSYANDTLEREPQPVAQPS